VERLRYIKTLCACVRAYVCMRVYFNTVSLAVNYLLGFSVSGIYPHTTTLTPFIPNRNRPLTLPHPASTPPLFVFSLIHRCALIRSIPLNSGGSSRQYNSARQDSELTGCSLHARLCDTRLCKAP
jgi:hypothetical protein